MALPRQEEYTPDPSEQLLETASQDFLASNFKKVISDIDVCMDSILPILLKASALSITNYRIVLLYFAAGLSGDDASTDEGFESHYAILMGIRGFIKSNLRMAAHPNQDPLLVKNLIYSVEIQYLLAKELAAKKPTDTRLAPLENEALQILKKYPHAKDLQELGSSAVEVICSIHYIHDKQDYRARWLKASPKTKGARLALATAQHEGTLPGIDKDEKAGVAVFKQLSNEKYIPGQHHYAKYLISRVPRFSDEVYNHGLDTLKTLATHYGPSAFALYEHHRTSAAEAKEWLKKAVALNHCLALCVHAENLLSLCITTDIFRQHQAEITQSLRLAAEAGNVGAADKLILLSSGRVSICDGKLVSLTELTAFLEKNTGDGLNFSLSTTLRDSGNHPKHPTVTNNTKAAKSPAAQQPKTAEMKAKPSVSGAAAPAPNQHALVTKPVAKTAAANSPQKSAAQQPKTAKIKAKLAVSNTATTLAPNQQALATKPAAKTAPTSTKLSAAKRRELQYQRELAAGESRAALQAEKEVATRAQLAAETAASEAKARQDAAKAKRLADAAAAREAALKRQAEEKVAAREAKALQEAAAARETALKLQAEKEAAAKALQDATNAKAAREREAKAPIKVRYYGNLWLVQKNRPLYFRRENKDYILHLPQDRPSTEIIDITPQPPKIHGVVA